MSIAKKLKYVRERRGVCQKELASYLKVSIGTISNYETGVHKPDLTTLGRIADFYGVSTDYLLERTNVPLPVKKLPPKKHDPLERLFADVVRLSPENREAVRMFEEYLQENEIQI
ncbi:MAG: helix-turn-helix domain-containing protein [Candidatus Gastranaerophilales bacterium]|nr:helix-turn-helix domain-containing protein [Candidatus Gastranaerophilales bacterium]